MSVWRKNSKKKSYFISVMHKKHKKYDKTLKSISPFKSLRGAMWACKKSLLCIIIRSNNNDTFLFLIWEENRDFSIASQKFFSPSTTLYIYSKKCLCVCDNNPYAYITYICVTQAWNYFAWHTKICPMRANYSSA